MSDFLLEIGLDEIPARMIAQAEAELGKRVSDLLTRERLLADGARIATYSTPRRLAVLAEGVLASQTDTQEQLTGPSWKVAFKDGAPTPAAEAFAKKAGVAISAIEKVTTPKGEYVGVTVTRKGVSAAQLLATELPKEALALYWAKNMYWRAGKPERFVRPIRWLVALLDSSIVPLTIAGIDAGNSSRGHRILHGEAPVPIANAKRYAEALRAAKVIVDVAERRQSIRKALDKATRTVPGARWREDEPLIETVTHLTEWPTVILGNFEAEYLALPEEVLVTVMRDHQKYFAVESADGKLAPHFLAVLNIEVDEEGYANIRHGNQKVLRARFKDARFFWDVDQKISLLDRVESLKSVTFQKELGSYYWKTEQNLAVANALAAAVKAAGLKFEEAALVKAVELAKTDLTAELVKEFTELQGVIGGLYAKAQGLGDTVAKAIYDQYTPASTDGAIPSTVEGQLLGLADRIQTITAMFGIGMAPTGSKDPFALRRAANSIVKILAESELPLTLNELLWACPAKHTVVHEDEVKDQSGIVVERTKITLSSMKRADSSETPPGVAAFLRERLHFYLKDVRGFSYDVVNAVLAEGADDVRDVIARAIDTTAKLGSEDFREVSRSFKRMKNILRQAEEKGIKRGLVVTKDISPEAYNLQNASIRLRPEVEKLRDQKAYGEALTLIATLRPAVDAFFNKVMVLDPDPEIREQHLLLIEAVLRNFSGIADFSEIVTS